MKEGGVGVSTPLKEWNFPKISLHFINLVLFLFLISAYPFRSQIVSSFLCVLSILHFASDTLVSSSALDGRLSGIPFKLTEIIFSLFFVNCLAAIDILSASSR